MKKKSFVEKVALDNVDINALGLYTLGELRKSSDKSDIEKYQISFEKYFLKVLHLDYRIIHPVNLRYWDLRRKVQIIQL